MNRRWWTSSENPSGLTLNSDEGYVGWIQVFSRGIRVHSRPKIFEIPSLGNAISAILRQSQRVLIPHFFNVKMPFLLHQNITKLHKPGANLHL